HHLSELLEGERHELLGRHLEDVGELGHRDELGDAHQRLLALFFLAPLLFLDVAETRSLVAAVHPFARDRALDRREGAGDVLRHRLLVHQRLLAFLALLPLVAAALFGRSDAGRGRRHGPGGRGRTAARRRTLPAPWHRAPARRPPRPAPRPGPPAPRPPYGGAAWAAPPAPPRPARGRRPSPPGAAWAVGARPSACASRAPSARASAPPAPA